jgi:hypothetical protein
MAELFSWLALIFLTLTGYSAGAVLGLKIRAKGPQKGFYPSLLDTMMVIVLWIGGIISRLAGLGKWSTVGIGVAVALLVAFILSFIQRQRDEGHPLPQ